jgi:hypothetical protein
MAQLWRHRCSTSGCRAPDCITSCERCRCTALCGSVQHCRISRLSSPVSSWLVVSSSFRCWQSCQSQFPVDFRSDAPPCEESFNRLLGGSQVHKWMQCARCTHAYRTHMCCDPNVLCALIINADAHSPGGITSNVPAGDVRVQLSVIVSVMTAPGGLPIQHFGPCQSCKVSCSILLRSAERTRVCTGLRVDQEGPEERRRRRHTPV